EYMDYMDDPELGNLTFGDYVAISPEGSIVATFTQETRHDYSITIKELATSKEKRITFNLERDDKTIGWSLAVSDIINNNEIGVVAISCITEKDMKPKRDEEINKYQILLKIIINQINMFSYFFDVREKGGYILPENLFKELEKYDDSRGDLSNRNNWKYLLKSRFQEFLMVDTSDYQQIQSIEIYNIDTSQLVNVFHRNRGEKDYIISKNNEPGIFAISTDSKLFAYSYGDDNITIYLMESGLELISGCLNDYFPISSIPIRHNDRNYHTLTKANGKIVFLNHNNQAEILPKTIIERSTFGENDVTDEYEYNSHDLEPWNNNTETITPIRGRFLNINDRKFLLIIGQNSIQVWKSNSQNFKDFEDFKNFENSNLVYILIHDNPTKFQIDDDMTTVITNACKSLAYLYNRTKTSINSKEKCEKFVSGIITIIKDFIEEYPDNWKLMEVQYPLMAYLIYSRSFSLIKYILFGVESKKKNTDTYLKSAKVLDKDLKSANDLDLALKFCQDQDAVMLAYLLEYYSENSMDHIGWMINVTKILPELSKHDYANYMDLLLYKPCFGEMKFNFPNKTFNSLSVSQDTLKVYIPLTQLISTDHLTILKCMKYKKIRYDKLPDICMIPLPNFTTYDTKIKDETVQVGVLRTLTGILLGLRNIIFPHFYKNKDFSPYLQVEKNIDTFFSIPAMEAVINSRWSMIIFSIILANSFSSKINGLNYEWMIFATSVTAFLLWIEMLLRSRLFSEIAINIYIFGNILGKILPFFAFMLILIMGVGHSMFILFGFSSLVDSQRSNSSFTLKNGTDNFTLTEETPNNPFDTPLDAILSAYNWDSTNLLPYKYWALQLLAFIASVVIVLILLNMIIALMNDTFNKAKEDGKLGLLIFRSELINDYERLNVDNPFFGESLNDNLQSPYICFRQDPDLMKRWKKKSRELKTKKLYSWFNESADKEKITFDINLWYEALISGNED
ncbi:5429_t:CDS:10, partial [Rhizophagus irregularis]